MTINELTFDPKNTRKRTARNLKMIEESINNVGFARSIVIDENNRILAGNGTVQASATRDNHQNVRIIETDGNEIIAVRRTGLTEEQKRQLSIADNRTAELSEWDSNILQEFIEEGFDLSPFFLDTELDNLLEVLEFEPETISTQGKLDEIAKCKCPNCGHEFNP